MDCKLAATKMHVEVKIRAYDETTDLHRADELEKQCEAGPGGSSSLFTDLLGDPLCRIRHYPAFSMLVAETQPEKELVGLVRAGVKEVACVSQSNVRVSQSSERSACKSEQSIVSDPENSRPPPVAPPHFVSIAYILGLRVAPRCRRLGIGAELVKRMEEWCKDRGAEYVYIATEKDNEASVGLFTKKLGYVEFRNPAILVQPVYVRCKKLSKKVQVVELSKEEACKLYNNPSLFCRSEFFPKDIEAVVRSKLHRGTWLAFWKAKEDDDGGGGVKQRLHSTRSLGFVHWDCFVSKSGFREVDCKDGRNDRRVRRFHGVLDSSGVSELDCTTASSWAVLSLWKCNEIYQLEMKGAPLRVRGAAAASRALGRMLSWLVSIPTMPDVFKPFGLQLIYGIHAQGPRGDKLARQLCWLAHNLAKDDGCAVVAAEVAGPDPLRGVIPHWTCDEDMWCIKRLSMSDPTSATVDSSDWYKPPAPASLFLDPRDF